jgi:Leucine-rich repeat (LRR) protein
VSLRFAALLLFIALSQSVQSLEIDCKFFGYDWNHWGEHYTCGANLKDVKIQNYRSVNVSSVKGQHWAGKSNNDVQAVQISGQKTIFLIQGLVHHFPNLQELYVSRSDLKHLSRSDFKNYAQLTTISLSRNHLCYLPYDTFEDLVNLEHFSLAFNQLSLIPNLKTLSKLKELYLFENSIESLSSADLSGNVNLEALWFYENKLKVIDSKIFELLPKLRDADFTHNRCISLKFKQHASDAFLKAIKENCPLSLQ